MNGPDFSKGNGLLPAIAQDHATGEVLMLGYMNPAAWQATLAGGKAVYYSRSRGRQWTKGEKSGHEQIVKQIYIDCDADTILLKVEQVGGAACHQGYRSCFFRKWDGSEFVTAGEKIFDPEEIYGKHKS